jgi:hypothetical protein
MGVNQNEANNKSPPSSNFRLDLFTSDYKVWNVSMAVTNWEGRGKFKVVTAGFFLMD